MGGVNNPEVDVNWRIPESLWERVEPLLPIEGPKPKGGRPRAPARQCMDGVFYVLPKAASISAAKALVSGA